MTDTPDDQGGSTVPSGRLNRFVRLGSMTAGIGGRMLLDGARQVASGNRPRIADLLLTPANALKITQQLAQMRGAAMKVGQLMSMDGGDFLPRELTDILARLRADAEHMPPAQLRSTLDRQWGRGWISRFAQFNVRPIAAASIGQVHRARTKDGRDLAIKVQYPGVRHSIDSDVTNVAGLLRLSGLLPKSLDIAPFLDEARRQLHEEADYAREGEQLTRYAALLADRPEFQIPRMHPDLSTPDVLAMDFIDSVPIETLITAPQATRDRVASLLIRLVLAELFDFNLMQTDPNFANYRYNPVTEQVVLLDFGATRSFSPDLAPQFRALLRAGLAGDMAAIHAAAVDIGYFDITAKASHQATLVQMIDLAMQPLRAGGVFDTGNTDLALQLRDMGMEMGTDRDFWHIPPVDVLFLHRKLGGLYLLATRLKARVDIASVFDGY